MASMRARLVAASVAALMPGLGFAASVDFESTTAGAYSSRGLPEGAVLDAGGEDFYITNPDIGSDGISGNSLTSYDPDNLAGPNLNPFRIDFASTIGSFSIAFDDDCFIGCDVDTGHLQAWGDDGLISEVSYSIHVGDEPGAGLLSVTSSAIKYVVFWSTSNVEDGANSVYWDNIGYRVSEVPLPGTLGLLGVGLAGLGLLRRKAS